MPKLFGTDGIRGIVNINLDGTLAYRVGQATAITLARDSGRKPRVAIGMDTRISSVMLENALTAGLCACGADVVKLGVIPTPAVAFLTVELGLDAGIVISASHNPFEHNGIKIFSAQGFKLSDALEEEIEALILQEEGLPLKTHGALGRVEDGTACKELYLRHLCSTVGDLNGLRIAVDCANGAASATARQIFDAFRLEVTYFNDSPNGVNINDGCGSTHLDCLSAFVKQGGYDLGIAFDGDADRCLAVDEKGQPIDGDRIMAICAMDLLRRGKLKNSGFVATVMSNLGLHKFAKENDLRLLCANVGDRNVLEMMQKENMCLGGEQSGHIIFLDHLTTGDGQLAALQFLQILCNAGRPVSEIVSLVTGYPQVLLNVTSPHDNGEKQKILSSQMLQDTISAAEKELAGDGRILVRASGTEALIRVMVEARTEEIAQNVAQRIAQIVEILQN